MKVGPRTLEGKRIGIFGKGGFGKSTVAILKDVAQEIGDTFQRPIELWPGFQIQDRSLDPRRGQHNSTVVLHLLQSTPLETGDRVLGVTTADLFIPIFTFVFGEAQLNGSVAVVSGIRLQNEFYGLAPNPVLYHSRLVKECIHELGHTFGLRHCRSVGCVMQKSTYVENIDLKNADFCLACSKFLQDNDSL